MIRIINNFKSVFQTLYGNLFEKYRPRRGCFFANSSNLMLFAPFDYFFGGNSGDDSSSTVHTGSRERLGLDVRRLSASSSFLTLGGRREAEMSSQKC